jgi:ADP-heptose:LPS heptosyltransferase
MHKYILILNNHGLGDVVMSIPFFENIINIEDNTKNIIIFKSTLEVELFKLTKIYNINKNYFILFNMKEINKVFIYIFRIKYAYSLGINESKSIKLFKLLLIKKYYIANPFDYTISSNMKILNNETKIHKSKLYSNLLKQSHDKDILIHNKDYFIKNNIKIINETNYIVFTAGSGELEKHKRWTISGYRKLLINIIDNTKYKVIFVGSKAEQEIVNNILVNIEEMYIRKVVQMNGKTNLLELISILRDAKLVVGNDNGVLHIASACNTSILGLFGSTDYKITGPSGNKINIIDNRTECAPCYKKDGNIRGCIDNICMKDINSDNVYSKVSDILDDR